MNVRPSQKFKDFLRSLINSIQSFQGSDFRPNCDTNSTTFVYEDGTVVFTMFSLRQKTDDQFFDWRVTFSKLVRLLTTVFDVGTNESICIHNWLEDCKSASLSPSNKIKDNLLKGAIFYTTDQRLGYVTRLWESIAALPKSSFALQSFGIKFKDWKSLVENDVKLLNIQRLNRRRYKMNDPNWVEEDDPYLWPHVIVKTQQAREHLNVASFIHWIRNAIVHFKDNEASLNQFSDNVSFRRLEDLLDTMDIVWPKHFHYIVEINKRLRLF